MSMTATVQSAAKAPRNAPSGLLIQRQCACGGSAGLTGQCEECSSRKWLGRPLQKKLVIGNSEDGFEKEADRVAALVMRMPHPHATTEAEQRDTASIVRRSVDGFTGTGAGPAQPIVQDVLALPGQPLDEATRDFFEPRFGHDFGNVRVHADERAAESARAVHASAYTVGRDIVFASGHYNQSTGEGRRLLAHELTHVVQQRSSGPGEMLQRSGSAQSVNEDERTHRSLSSGLDTSHEIVINGELFNLVPIPAAVTPESPAWRYRDSAKDYLGAYPNLGNGAWALIVRQRDGVLCDIGGNCLGWAIGNYGLIDPPERVWGLARQYLDSVGRSVGERRSPLESYMQQVKKGRSEAGAIWDYYMATQFQTVPTESEADANLALYGQGFSGPMEGPTHIAFRTAAGELWASKPSPSKSPVLHETAAQMTGGQTGEVLRLYVRTTGPMSHVVVRERQAQVNP